MRTPSAPQVRSTFGADLRRRLLAELLGTGLLVTAVVGSGRTSVAPAAVAAWIGGAYWFTSSTSFANPAVTLGRGFSDTFAGISPGSVPAFIVAQAVGLVLALALAAALYPSGTTRADDRGAEDLVVPHQTIDRNPR